MEPGQVEVQTAAVLPTGLSVSLTASQHQNGNVGVVVTIDGKPVKMIYNGTDIMVDVE
jgi:hypothetical protein